MDGESNVKGEGRSSTGKGSASKNKEGKSRLVSITSGTRFQCPRCPKNFTRIENLTRHQANHDDVGKFVCPICQKRFTRSDLLNRHRRIHGDQASPSKHVTPAREYSDLDSSHSKGLSHLGHQDGRRSTLHKASSSHANPQFGNQMQQQMGMYSNQNQDGYQHGLAPQDVSRSGSSMVQNQSGREHNLSGLMEAALAPEEFSFNPAESLTPSLWNGFVGFDNSNAGNYMGSFDADITWTLNQFHSESSMDYSLDYAMMSTEYTDPYAPPISQYQQPEVNQIEASDAVDQDTNDWPDKIDNPPGKQHAPRIVPVQLLPMSWQSVVEEARSSGLTASTIPPAQHVTDHLRASLLDALNGSRFHYNELSRPEIGDAMFPPSQVLDFFLRLYIKYIQPRFPVLHLPTFDIFTAPPLLLIAMIFLGSSHSKIDQGRISRIYHPHLRVACLRLYETDPAFLRNPEDMWTFCLLCFAGTWSGSKQGYAFAEAARGIIVTAVRRNRLLDCRPLSKSPAERFRIPSVDDIQATWMAWVETEKRKRLGLSVYIFDSQYPALFNSQPYVSKAETTNCIFPCPEEYWEATTASEWRMLVGPADTPPSTYYLHALNACLFRAKASPPPTIPKTNEFGKTVLMYALLTQIFEWRQSASMLNPTGLMGALGSPSAQEMGSDLKLRRRMLSDALDSWSECYNTTNETSAAALLLHRLAYISLDVSLSDMHLAAGRSGNTHDADFADENLRHWADSEVSYSTMEHVFGMLELCHRVIGVGGQGEASYEVAVCLFTGGIVCWAYARLRKGLDGDKRGRELYWGQLRRAAGALSVMGCWRTAGLHGRILNGFLDRR